MTMDSMNPGRGSEWVMCITAEGSTSTTVVLMKLSRSSRFSVSWAYGGQDREGAQPGVLCVCTHNVCECRGVSIKGGAGMGCRRTLLLGKVDW